MTLKLQPVTTASDCHRLGEIHMYAFLTSPLNATIYYNGPSQAILDATAARHLDGFQNDPTVRFMKVVDDSTSPPKLIAFARFNVFDSRLAVDKRQDTGDITWPPGMNVKLVNQFWAALVKCRETWGPRLGKHLSLHILATDPQYQRRGAGRMLMNHLTGVADEKGLPCYLEGSPEGERLYRSCGFQVVGSDWTDVLRFADGGDKGPEFRKSIGLDEREGVGEGWYQELIMVRPAKGMGIDDHKKSEKERSK